MKNDTTTKAITPETATAMHEALEYLTGLETFKYWGSVVDDKAPAAVAHRLVMRALTLARGDKP